MLPQFRRYAVFNNSGQTVTFNNNGRVKLKYTSIYIDPSTGKLVYSSPCVCRLSFIAGQSVADGAEVLSDEISNTAYKYINDQVQLEITHDEGTAADGTFDIYLLGGDATGELPSDATGYADAEANKLLMIGSLTWESNGLDDEVMTSNVFTV